MGLHVNVPQSQLIDGNIKEHRNRVWWSVYILDRQWATMLGQPVTIGDEYVDVDLPSRLDAPTGSAEDFDTDPECLTAGVRVAKLAAQITASIYTGRMTLGNTFAQRMQQALRDLTSWLAALPDHLRLAMNNDFSNASMQVITLHLYFNQVSNGCI